MSRGRQIAPDQARGQQRVVGLAGEQARRRAARGEDDRYRRSVDAERFDDEGVFEEEAENRRGRVRRATSFFFGSVLGFNVYSKGWRRAWRPPEATQSHDGDRVLFRSFRFIAQMRHNRGDASEIQSFEDLKRVWGVEDHEVDQTIRGLRFEAYLAIFLAFVAFQIAVFSMMSGGHWVYPVSAIMYIPASMMWALTRWWRAQCLLEEEFAPFWDWLLG